MSAISQAFAPTKASSFRTTTIGTICDEFGGEVQTGPFGSQLHASDYNEDGVPVVMPQDMVNGRIVCDRIARVSERHVVALRRHKLLPGDLVFSRRGDVTRFALVTARESGWLCGTGSIRIRMNSPEVLPEYAKRYLQQASVGQWLLNEAKGITMPNLNTKIIRALPFVVPPIKEQRRIAAILDQAETLRTQRRAAMALLDSLTQSLFLEMFGDPLDNTKRWEWRCMSELFETSPIFGTMIPGEAERGSWLCLRVANIQDWQLTLEDKKYVDLPTSAVERHSVKAGDLLMARAIASQEHLGKCVVAQPGDELWAFDSHLMRLRFRADRAVPEFIRQLLRTPGGRNIFLKASRKSSVQYNINTKEISALEVPVPPLSLQQTFATRIASIQALKATHRRALAALDALFASLQQRAFAGQL